MNEDVHIVRTDMVLDIRNMFNAVLNDKTDNRVRIRSLKCSLLFARNISFHDDIWDEKHLENF